MDLQKPIFSTDFQTDSLLIHPHHSLPTIIMIDRPALSLSSPPSHVLFPCFACISQPLRLLLKVVSHVWHSRKNRAELHLMRQLRCMQEPPT